MPSPPNGSGTKLIQSMTIKTMTAAAAAFPGESAATMEEIDPHVLLEALGLLDGPALAAASCANSHLRSLCSDSSLWLRLCLSTWPSLRHRRLLSIIEESPRHFFRDAYPFPTAATVGGGAAENDLPDKLVSAVDLYHRGVHIFSRVIDTDTSTSWFRGSPFRISALERKDRGPPHHQPTEAMLPEDMTLSWILIDPEKRRAVNVSSRKAVAVDRRQWCLEETLVRFATVAEEAIIAVGAVVASDQSTGQVVEVGLTIEDMDGTGVFGSEGLKVVKAAMEAGRRRRGRGEEEAAAMTMYLEYLEKKGERKKMREMKEGLMDCCCTAVSLSIFLAFTFSSFSGRPLWSRRLKLII